ncbi:MAG TPA: xanthine dehydrogenase accessory protein XdhC [Ramlibacter sp.]|uniref:xanthine dehydrogenase accessory protein XdhC n=1 Tax=Ramlibacter sp. TaxID=1917967 RepID=UPI002BBA5CC6|nr:xanthine dehydrogenase accessory protein XdhC [Ramlibacter sp.]HVZ44749.1 xanthine dehydrogenase accessory protein XdhC [Ramlibacter sp.]
MNEITQRLAREDAVLVWVERTQGSVPREEGTWMAVLRNDVVGTIGGGHLEFEAIGEARRRLAGATGDEIRRYPLGPTLGQCCGGVVFLRFEKVAAGQDATPLTHRLAAQRAPLALFGGGHVGRALVHVLGTLPFEVTWIDSRDEIFPAGVPHNVHCEHSDPVHSAVRELAANSRVLVMSFSHAQDLDIVAACLERQRERADLSYIGLIGSKTKWAVFRHRLEARGFAQADFARVTCPIGVPGIAGKEPEVIAVAVAAQLLQIPRDPLA